MHGQVQSEARPGPRVDAEAAPRPRFFAAKAKAAPRDVKSKMAPLSQKAETDKQNARAELKIQKMPVCETEAKKYKKKEVRETDAKMAKMEEEETRKKRLREVRFGIRSTSDDDIQDFE